MIGLLRGKVAQIGEGDIIVDCNGVGYLVQVTQHVLQNIHKEENIELWVETRSREHEITLYGFMDEYEKRWFNMVTSVQGVGAKGGLAILSILTPKDLLLAISAGDKGIITRANGIGPKIAARIISELKDKVGSIVGGHSSLNMPKSSDPKNNQKSNIDHHLTLVQEVSSALINLGYGPSEATAAATAALQLADENANIETLIPLALNELSGSR